MRKLKRSLWCGAVVAAAAIGVALHASPVSGNWATGAALGSVAVSFDGEVTVYRGPALADTETIAVAGANYELAFDNGLNLFVANSDNSVFPPVDQIVRLGEAATHGQLAGLASAPGARALAFAGDGTLYVASAGGTIRRYAKTLASYTDFTVNVETSDCIGIDLGADQTSLFIVSGGRNVFVLPNADAAAGNQVANTAVFTAAKKLSGSGAACGIRLAAPERGSLEKRHGGMFIADRVDIKRLSTVGLETSAFKGSGSGQNWVSVAIDPRMVYDANNPATGVDPNQYIIWGADAGQRRIASFQTPTATPLQVVSTDPDVPRGIAVNGELRVAQVVRLLTLAPNGNGSADFLEGSPYPHSWKAQSVSTAPAQLAVMAYEFTSDGLPPSPSPPPDDGNGRCVPSLDADCRFDSFAGTPKAVAYSRGRAVGYRVVRFDPLTPAASGRVSIVYADANPTGAGQVCGGPAGVATSILRDPYAPTFPSTQYGHDQFEFDETLAFFDFDDGVNTETVPDMGTDYVVVARTDATYTARLQKPEGDLTNPTTPQLGRSQPITLIISNPANCQPVGGLADKLVLTVTELGSSTNTTKGTRVGDSETPGSLGVNGLAPWVFNGAEWRTNLSLDPPQFKADTYYAICVNTKAVLNTRLTNDVCAIIKPVMGSGQ